MQKETSGSLGTTTTTTLVDLARGTACGDKTSSFGGRLFAVCSSFSRKFGTFVLVERCLHFCRRHVRNRAIRTGHDPAALTASPSRKASIFQPDQFSSHRRKSLMRLRNGPDSCLGIRLFKCNVRVISGPEFPIRCSHYIWRPAAHDGTPFPRGVAVLLIPSRRSGSGKSSATPDRSPCQLRFCASEVEGFL
jgi:hypothetical protein